jgi:hypothetical protein
VAPKITPNCSLTPTRTVCCSRRPARSSWGLFSLLTLPIGAVAKLVSAGTMHGSVGRLYQSVEQMGGSFLQPGIDKSDLLQPKVLHPDARELLLLLQGDGGKAPPLARFRMFTCSGYCATATVEGNATCPLCGLVMTTEVAFVLPSSGDGGSSVGEAGGYVKGAVTYMVTDGLEVTPMSAISSITLINKFSSAKDVQPAEMYVTVGEEEVRFISTSCLHCCSITVDSADISLFAVLCQGLALLKEALRSDTVLTNVFLAKRK